MRSLSSNEASESSTGDNLLQTAESEILPTQETTFVPESQPVVDSPYKKYLSVSNISSPLTDPYPFVDPLYESHHESAYFSSEKVANEPSTSFTRVPVNFKPSPQLPTTVPRDLPSSRPPSSSTGDTMLLEAEEEPKRIKQHDDRTFWESSKQRLGPQSEANSPERLPGGETEDLFSHGATKTSSKTAKAKSKGDAGSTSKHQSPRRLRIESLTRIKKAMPLQERAPSDQNIPVSPQGGMIREKYLPNSTAKRRFEDNDISVFSSPKEGSKRLKRNLSAMEIKSLSKRRRPYFIEHLTPVTGSGRLNHPSMPTGSRKRSVIGTSTPAPRLGSHASKKSRKGPKTDRYSARFNQGTT